MDSSSTGTLELRVNGQRHRLEVAPDWREALERAAAATPPGETLFILPTYKAMLELRSVLTRDGVLQPYWQSRPTGAKP